MNAAFINTLYQPDEEEMRRRESLQRELSLVQTELAYIFRDCSPFERSYRKEIFHRKFRERSIKLVSKN